MHDPDDVPALPGILLSVPIPPGLAEAFGYPGDCRFVGFCWELAGDELVYDDRRRSGTGDGYAFLAYKRHPAVFPHLAPYNLGSSDGEAEYYLILDRQQPRASVAPLAEARSFLEVQHAPLPEVTPTGQIESVHHLMESLAQGWQEVVIDPEVIRRRMDEQRQTMARMLAFLDQYPSPLTPHERQDSDEA